jgi:hypothetical protein
MIAWGLIGEALFQSTRERRLVNCYRHCRQAYLF